MMDSIPIDPHHEKWSKLLLPQTRGNEQVEHIEKKMKEYLKLSSTQTSGFNTSQQSFKGFSKSNDYLSQYHEKISKQYEDLLRTKQHQPFPKYGSENVSTNFIISPDQINPLLKASEERIKALEEEMHLREREVSKLAGMTELLIDENKYLRDHIAFKNKDIAKILETIGLNDGESIHDLRHRINLLTEENNMLLTHLEEMRVVKENFDRFTKERNAELEKSRDLYENVRNSLEDALAREENLTSQKLVLENRYHQGENRVLELERDLDDLVTEYNQTKNNLSIVQNQAQNYRKAYEDLEAKYNLEKESLAQDVSNYKNEKRELQQALDQRDRQIDTLRDENRRLLRGIDQKQLESDDFLQTVKELKDQYEREKNKNQETQKREREWKEKYDQAINEANLANMKAQQNENQIRKLQDAHSAELQQRQVKYDKALESLRTKKEDLTSEREAEVQSLNKQIADMKKVMDRLREEKNSLSEQVRELQTNRVSVNSPGSERRSFRDDEVAQLRLENERLHNMTQEFDSLQRENENLVAENENLRATSQKVNDMNKSLVQELRTREVEAEARKSQIENANSREEESYNQEGGKQVPSQEYNKAETETRQHSKNLSGPAATRNLAAIPEVEAQGYEKSPSRKPAPGTGAGSYSPRANEQGHQLLAAEYELMKELQGENQYLRDMLKNIITSNDQKNAPGQQESQTYEHQQTVNFSVSSPLKPDFTSSSKKMHSYNPISLDYTHTNPNVTQKDDNIDKVVKNILEKYNLTSVPDKTDLNRIFGSNESSRIRSSLVSPVHYGGGRNYEQAGGEDDQYVRTSGMNFLSPLMSSGDKYESKLGSYQSSAARY